MSLFSVFKTDSRLEKEGVIIDYDDFKFRIARAGGANTSYNRLLRAKLRPYRHRIDTGTVSNEALEKLLVEVYAETVVLGWEGVCDEQGNEIEFSKENCVKLLTELPDLFLDLQAQAEDYKIFRQAELEEEAKN